MLDINGHSIYLESESCNLRRPAAVWTETGPQRRRGRQTGPCVSVCAFLGVCQGGQEVDVGTCVIWYIGNLSPWITWWNLSHQAKDRPKLSHSHRVNQRGRQTGRESQSGPRRFPFTQKKISQTKAEFHPDWETGPCVPAWGKNLMCKTKNTHWTDSQVSLWCKKQLEKSRSMSNYSGAFDRVTCHISR